jgi:hypothetical protein
VAHELAEQDQSPASRGLYLLEMKVYPTMLLKTKGEFCRLLEYPTMLLEIQNLHAESNDLIET